MSRDVRKIEFVPSDTAGVVAEMVQLTAAGDGWINLLPGVPDEEPPPRASLLGSLVGAAPAAVTMCTWMPPRSTGRRVTNEVTVGILHPRGRRGAFQLAGLGVAVPDGWRVRQDHARRGLILMVPADESNTTVLDWTLSAGAALAVAPLTGSWQAHVYLPVRRR